MSLCIIIDIIVLKIPGLMSLNTQTGVCLRHILIGWRKSGLRIPKHPKNGCLCEPQIWSLGSLNTQMDVCVSHIMTKYANLGAQGSLHTQIDVRVTVSASYSCEIRKSGLQDA